MVEIALLISYFTSDITTYQIYVLLFSKVGQALGLSTEWSNHPFYAPGNCHYNASTCMPLEELSHMMYV